MTTPVSKIDELIAQNQARQQEAIAKVQRAEARYKEAQEALREIELELRGLELARDGVSSLPSSRSRSGTRPRGPSFAWRRILQYIGSKGPQGASLDEIEQFVLAENLEIQRGAIRSQLSNYKLKRVLESVGDAVYELTPEGAGILVQLSSEEA